MLQDIPGLAKDQIVIVNILAVQETFKDHRKIFWSLQDIPRLGKDQKTYFGSYGNLGDFWKSCKNILKLARHSRACQTSGMLISTFWPCVPQENLSHSRLLCLLRLICPMWDCYVPLKTNQSHMRLLCLSQMRLLCPTWDFSVLHETALSHMRLLCPLWDCSVPHKTYLSQKRLLCPTWGCSFPYDIASSIFCKAQKTLYFLPFFCIFTFCPCRDWISMGLGRDWNETGTGLGHKQDWDNARLYFWVRK